MQYRLIINIVLFIGCCFFVGCFQSCSDITDMHKDYLNRGEKIYVGKIDSLKVRGGFGRLQIEGLSRYTRSAERCIVSWGDEQQIELQMKEIIQGDSVKILLNNLSQGTYRLFVQTFDLFGNKSLKEECLGFSYGEDFKLTQAKKMIMLFDIESTNLILHWNFTETAASVKISYENSKGENIIRFLPGDVIITEIEDWKLGAPIEIVTYVSPEKNALDIIPLDAYIQIFPSVVEYKNEKSKLRDSLE